MFSTFNTRGLVRSSLIVIGLLLGSLMFLPELGAQFRPNIPGRPNIPQPNIPQPNFPQPNIPAPTIPRFETVYKCSRCGQEVGRGTRPNVQSCPSCGASFINGGGGGRPPSMPAPGRPGSPNPNPNPPADPFIESSDDPQSKPQKDPQAQPQSQPQISAPNFTPMPEEKFPFASRSTITYIIIAVVLSVMAVVGTVVALLVAKGMSSRKPRRRRSRYR